MKAAVLHQYDELLKKPSWVVYEDVPDPIIEKPTDVIVKIGGAGVCRTDLHIIQGSWRNHARIHLPHILGHENAGWVEEIGNSVRKVKVGDPVIVHPMGETVFWPGINVHGGYAEYLRTGEETLLKLPHHLVPMDVAPYADAGLAAYHVGKKASRKLLPGQYVVVLGAGGLGHIGVQVIRALCAAEIIAVDSSDKALDLAKMVGAHHTILSSENPLEEIFDITGGHGADAVIDFVAEGDAVQKGLAMTRRGGVYYVVGYGGKLEISTLDLVISGKTIVGNLIGTYAELLELMKLVDRGMVKAVTQEYPLSNADGALHDLRHGRVHGRAVLIP